MFCKLFCDDYFGKLYKNWCKKIFLLEACIIKFIDNSCYPFYSVVTHIIYEFCWDFVYFRRLSLWQLNDGFLYFHFWDFYSIMYAICSRTTVRCFIWILLFKISVSLKSTFLSLFFTPCDDRNFLGLRCLTFMVYFRVVCFIE